MELFPKQEEIIHFFEMVETGDDLGGFTGIVEKSRDMGVTWLVCFFLIHRWLFRPGFKGAVGSRKEDLVDKSDDPDCIFEKLRFIIRHLPKWMLPRGWNDRIHDKHMLLLNPETGSTITGEGGNNIGRGGRNMLYFVDESAFLENPISTDKALANNSRCVIHVSTVNGNGNPFAQKAKQAKEKPTGRLKLMTAHWKSDPRHNFFELKEDEFGNIREFYPWYEAQKEILHDPVIIAQELDIDYTASIEGIVIPAKYVDAAINFEQWLLQTKGIRMPRGTRNAGFDIAGESGCDNAFVVGEGAVVTIIKLWSKLDTFLSTKMAINLGNAARIRCFNYDANAIGLSMSGNFKSAGLGQQFETYGINGQGKCTGRKWPVAIDIKTGKVRYKLSKEKFTNYRSESWWVLRERFEKTYEYKVLGINHPLHELISIPHHLKLVSQLSDVLCTTDNSGKIKVESKMDMKERNVPSPDIADAVVYLYCPKRIKQEQPKESTHQESWA